MSDIKQIREQLGFSQEDMAGYLAISRSHLSMYELNQRDLPMDALLRWNLLEKSLAENTISPPAKAATVIAKEGQKSKQQLQQRLKKLNWQIKTLQYQLAALKVQYQQCTKALHTVALLKANAPKGLSETDKACLNYLEVKNMNRLVYCNEHVQNTMNLQINSLLFEVGEIDKLITG